jgi:hypothetical protein
MSFRILREGAAKEIWDNTNGPYVWLAEVPKEYLCEHIMMEVKEQRRLGRILYIDVLSPAQENPWRRHERIFRIRFISMPSLPMPSC